MVRAPMVVSSDRKTVEEGTVVDVADLLNIKTNRRKSLAQSMRA